MYQSERYHDQQRSDPTDQIKVKRHLLLLKRLNEQLMQVNAFTEHPKVVA
jgi:hypothetical protein